MSSDNFDSAIYYPGYINPNPMILPEQLRSVHQSWQRIKAGQYPIFQAHDRTESSSTFWGNLFYTTLFELEPELESMFQNNVQRTQIPIGLLDEALGLLTWSKDGVLGAERITTDAKLVPTLTNLAKRQVSEDFRVSHYGPLGLALVATLEVTLGEAFDNSTMAAWIELWSLICTVMIPAHVEKARELGLEVR